jgi:type IV pilus assembly protein PilB
MSIKNKVRVGQQLLAAGLITEDKLDAALKEQSRCGGFLGDVLVKMGLAPADLVGQMIAATIGVPYINLANADLSADVFDVVPDDYQRQHTLLPLRVEHGTLVVAMSDPLNVPVIDNLQHITGFKVSPILALHDDLRAAINRAHSMRNATESVLREIENSLLVEAEPDVSADELIGMAEDAPIVRLVNSIIAGAINCKASDIHIEPQEKRVRVRYRVDGVMSEQMTYQVQHHPAVVSRVKIMAHLNIAERRRPQDGRIAFGCDGLQFDLRVSTLHMNHGEKVVLRLLDKSSVRVPLENLGFSDQQLAQWTNLLKKPHGMMLVTGPTGSGKSTTLYASLNRINDASRNIITIEDPIEYELAGINQSQVHPKIGVTFAAGLRAIVRQDPDVILVGEIRDSETAEIAVQAAMTGHLVFTTLHTNDAPGALVRLDNMGVERYLIASAVVGVMGQRLLRKNCPECSEPDSPDPDMVAALGIAERDLAGAKFMRGAGCARCSGRGLRGRTAVYEVMPMTPRLRDGLRRGFDGAELKKIALADGMVTLRQSGIQKALSGETTLHEVCRVLMEDEEEEIGFPVEHLRIVA